jgi:dihydrofolate synthase/folylpolyglutamate synthase
MNYQEVLSYIDSTNRFGSRLGLENISVLLELMGNPHRDLKVIHVAGTNGKGSTCSFIATVLAEQGYKVGLYTSPYLEEFSERISINGQNISNEKLAEIGTLVKSKVNQMISKGMEHPTEFEIITAIGFEYFRREQVDFLILEVGLGGRADATNVVKKPLVSVITPIAFDHMDCLGNSIAKIAYEKAGIIKSGSCVVSYPQESEAMEVIETVCKQQNAKLIKAPIDSIRIVKQNDTGQRFHTLYGDLLLRDIQIRMIGDHQIQNAVVAMTALYVLNKEYNVSVDTETLYRGLEKTLWPGRLEIIHQNPTVLIDGAHNPHGVKALSKVIQQLFPDRRIILGIGILKDKDVEGMLDFIVPFAEKLVLTKPNSPRALSVSGLESLIEKHKKPYIVKEKISDAVQTALSLANPDTLIIFAGSLYMIGEVRKLFRNGAE